MSDQSGIEWTDATWNPVTGCTKVSPGCKRCYAERLAGRLRAMGNPRYRNGFEVTLHPDQLALPLRWPRPRRIFVNSMSDLFHEDIPDDYIRRVFDVMVEARRHTFQILTKRSGRLATLAASLPWPSNIWQGVSVESQHYTLRINHLQTVPAAVRFSRSSRSSAPSRSSRSPGSTGSSWEGRAGRGIGRWRPHGLVRSAISASMPAWHSSSNSGAAGPRNPAGASSTVAPGMRRPS